MIFVVPTNFKNQYSDRSKHLELDLSQSIYTKHNNVTHRRRKLTIGGRFSFGYPDLHLKFRSNSIRTNRF